MTACHPDRRPDTYYHCSSLLNLFPIYNKEQILGVVGYKGFDLQGAPQSPLKFWDQYRLPHHASPTILFKCTVQAKQIYTTPHLAQNTN